MNEYMTLKETMELLRISRSTLFRRLKDKTIPSVKLHGKRLVLRKKLKKMLETI